MALAYARGLVCRECGEMYDLAPLHVCELCFGPLEVAYDYDAIRASISREEIEAGPPTVWRYRKKGILNTVNIYGRQYILRSEIARFNARAASGEFARTATAPMVC